MHIHCWNFRNWERCLKKTMKVTVYSATLRRQLAEVYFLLSSTKSIFVSSHYMSMYICLHIHAYIKNVGAYFLRGSEACFFLFTQNYIYNIFLYLKIPFKDVPLMTVYHSIVSLYHKLGTDVLFYMLKFFHNFYYYKHLGDGWLHL